MGNPRPFPGRPSYLCAGREVLTLLGGHGSKGVHRVSLTGILEPWPIFGRGGRGGEEGESTLVTDCPRCSAMWRPEGPGGALPHSPPGHTGPARPLQAQGLPGGLSGGPPILPLSPGEHSRAPPSLCARACTHRHVSAAQCCKQLTPSPMHQALLPRAHYGPSHHSSGKAALAWSISKCSSRSFPFCCCKPHRAEHLCTQPTVGATVCLAGPQGLTCQEHARGHALQDPPHSGPRAQGLRCAAQSLLHQKLHGLPGRDRKEMLCL